MMAFFGCAIRTLLRSLRDIQGFNTTDVTMAAFIVATLGAAITPVILDKVEDARITRAVIELNAIHEGSLKFFQDTGFRPGQLEIRAGGGKFFLRSGTAPLPGGLSDQAIRVPAAGTVDCPPGGAVTFSDATALNINDYLVSRPPHYPNWKGPYISQEADMDPFGRAYVLHVLPQFCGETVTVAVAGAGGELGYAWLLSGGPDTVIQQQLNTSKPNPTIDDVGIVGGKRTLGVQ